MFGITGTNGKTTVTHLLDAGLRAAGHRTGVIGTVGVSIAGESHPGSRTTPEATDLHELLAVMRDHEVDAVSMEVSSHGLAQGRVHGVEFDVALFTNLTRDHLDYHESLEAYFNAKMRLFEELIAPGGAAVVGQKNVFEHGASPVRGRGRS